MIRVRRLSALLPVLLLVIALFISVRYLLPYGDEADFGVRVGWIVTGNHFFWTPYYYFSGALSQVDWFSADLDAYSLVLRLGLTLMAISPLLIYIIFEYLFVPKSNLVALGDGRYCYPSVLKVNLAIIVMIFPSIWFHLGVLAEEQFVLVLLLFAVFNFKRLTVVFLCTYLAFLLDMGNALVFIVFLVLYGFNFFALKKFGLKFLQFAILISLVLSLVFSMRIFEQLELIPLVGAKVTRIVHDYTYIYDVNDKYPLLLRPVITFMGMFLLLPNSHTYFIPLYVLGSFFLGIIIWRVSNSRFHDNSVVVGLYSSLQLLLAAPVVLPGFSNAKYYVFLIPFFLRAALFFYPSVRVFMFVLFCSLLVITELLFNALIKLIPFSIGIG